MDLGETVRKLMYLSRWLRGLEDRSTSNQLGDRRSSALKRSCPKNGGNRHSGPRELVEKKLLSLCDAIVDSDRPGAVASEHHRRSTLAVEHVGGGTLTSDDPPGDRQLRTERDAQ